ncbi:MAG: DNA-3-methyladenine glycosylase [Bacillota bacterium]
MNKIKKNRLRKDFYAKDAVTLAQDLIGKIVVRIINQIEIQAKIVETEAYVGPEDKACHAYNNRRTARTEVMYKPPGHAYIYLIYGMHHCFNIVAAEQDKPEAVLIRAVEPVKGVDFIKEERQIGNRSRTELTNGPGKLTQALSITKDLNGISLVTNGKLFLIDSLKTLNKHKIKSALRININYAEEYIKKPWRFYLESSEYISAR